MLLVTRSKHHPVASAGAPALGLPVSLSAGAPELASGMERNRAKMRCDGRLGRPVTGPFTDSGSHDWPEFMIPRKRGGRSGVCVCTTPHAHPPVIEKSTLRSYHGTSPMATGVYNCHAAVGAAPLAKVGPAGYLSRYPNPRLPSATQLLNKGTRGSSQCALWTLFRNVQSRGKSCAVSREELEVIHPSRSKSQTRCYQPMQN